MLPSDSAVESVYSHPCIGILAFISSLPPTSPRKLIMECGNVDQSIIDKVSQNCKPHNIDFVDSAAGTRSFMIGCPEPLFSRIRAVLEMMGTRIFRCGNVGAGSALKIINNYISIISVLAAAEALNIGAKLGLDLTLLNDLINSSSGQYWVTAGDERYAGKDVRVV